MHCCFGPLNHTFKSINVCEQVNKLTLFIRCFEQCSVAKKKRSILACAFIWLTFRSILVCWTYLFNEKKKKKKKKKKLYHRFYGNLLNPESILKCLQRLMIMEKNSIYDCLYLPMNHLQVISTFWCPTYWISLFFEGSQLVLTWYKISREKRSLERGSVG